MVQVTLRPEEAVMLREVLESYISDLRMEISNTDSMDFRQGLKSREEFLKRLLQQLAGPSP
jgi:hypothetical protein